LIGKRLAHYDITAKLGEGGMGEVWRATDTKLNRDVAIKVLPSEMAADPERLERFKREAQAIAALSHPSIVTIYSVEEAEGLQLLTMELVEGDSLDQVLPPQGFELGELFSLATQISDALASAHDRGIIHRDLKPANVMVARAGRVKVLDFGLAKLADAGDGDEETELMTQAGMLLGTVPYMSPEQAQAKPVDHRSDVFSLGILLYEMATGQRPFQGDNPASVISALLKDRPPSVTELRADLPNHLGRIVRRCLEKAPQRRYQSAREIQLELEGLERELSMSNGGVDPRPATQPPGASYAGSTSALTARWLNLVPWATASVAVVAMIVVSTTRSGPLDEPTDPPRVRALTYSGNSGMPSVSADGRTMAFMSNRDGRARIWLKQMAGGEAPLTEGQDIYPDLSPDGAAVAFMRFPKPGSPPTVFRRQVVGGKARPLVEFGGGPAWSPDGEEIAFLRRFPDGSSAVLVVGADGGEPVELHRNELILASVSWSSDGRLAGPLMTTRTGRTGKILILDRDSGETTVVTIGAPEEVVCAFDWGPDGDLVIVTASDTRAAPGLLQTYDLESGARRAIAWLENGSEVGQLDVIGDSIVFDLVFEHQTLTETSPTGASRPLTTGPTFDRQPVLSPDGELILFSSHRGGAMDLWLQERTSGTLTQITFDSASDLDPAFTADGAGILWSSDRDEAGIQEIWTMELDGTRARQLSNDGSNAENPSTWPGGDWIFYATSNVDHPGIWKMRTDGSEATPIEGVETGTIPEVSPDGRWVAYVDVDLIRGVNHIRVMERESGKLTNFAIAVPAPRRGPGVGSLGRSRWSADSSTLYFLGQNEAGDNGLSRQRFHPTEDTSSTREEVMSSEGGIRILETFDLTPEGGLVLSHLVPTSDIKIAEGVFAPLDER